MYTDEILKQLEVQSFLKELDDARKAILYCMLYHREKNRGNQQELIKMLGEVCYETDRLELELAGLGI